MSMEAPSVTAAKVPIDRDICICHDLYYKHRGLPG